MKTLEDFGIKDNSGYVDNSAIAGIAIELACEIKTKYKEFSLHLTELSMSFVNLRYLALRNYGRLAFHSKKIIDEKEEKPAYYPLLADFAFNFITNAKASIDLFACILDAIESRIIKEANELTDLPKYQKKTANTLLKNPLNDLLSFPWYKNLKVIRDRVIHRGALIEFFFTSAHEIKSKKIDEVKLFENLPEINHEENNISKLRNDLDKRTIEIDRRISEKNDLMKMEFAPKLESFLCKRNLGYWTRKKEQIDDEWFSDGFGRIKTPINIEKIAEGFINSFKIWEKNLCDSMIANKFIPEINNYSILKNSFTPTGPAWMVHKRLGDLEHEEMMDYIKEIKLLAGSHKIKKHEPK